MTPLRPDDVHRTALLAAHDGSQPTLGAAVAAHARTGVMICADTRTCRDISGQAALLTAVVTARRAFGTVTVLAADPAAVLTTGIFTNQTIASAVTSQGAQLIQGPGPAATSPDWPVLLIGPATPAPHCGDSTYPTATIRASWSGWTARVTSSILPVLSETRAFCVPAAIAAAALGVSEAFGAIRARPGSDAGYRDITLNLWNPGGGPAASPGPDLAYAPYAWWLVGLGHLGQATAWVISWLPYTSPADVEITLQDTGRTTPANYSTGVLTPEESDNVLKTRLVAAVLETAGFTTRLIERCTDASMQVAPAECHVAIIGVDNLNTRRLTSGTGWPLAIDLGLGDRPDTFDSILLRRFPGIQRSDRITAWQAQPAAVTVPTTPAFIDLQARHDKCGVTELAGKAVGAAFTGITAACLAITEATRELHGGTGRDCLMLSLTSMTPHSALASQPVRIASMQLHPGGGGSPASVRRPVP